MTYFPLSYAEMFSVEKILISRGFAVESVNDLQSVFILNNFNTRSDYIDGTPGTHNNEGRLLYKIFNNSVHRKELLDYIEKKDPEISETVNELIKHEKFNNNRYAYSTAFEWYIGELMIREFAAFSSSVGVKVANVFRNSSSNGTTGDYDVITVLRNMGISYFECKTGHFNTDKIIKSVERALALHVDFVIMAIDNSTSEKRLKGLLQNAKFPINNITSLKKISLMNSSVVIYNWFNCYFINTTLEISDQIKTVLRIIDADKISNSISFGCSAETYLELGYKVETIMEMRKLDE